MFDAAAEVRKAHKHFCWNVPVIVRHQRPIHKLLYLIYSIIAFVVCKRFFFRCIFFFSFSWAKAMPIEARFLNITLEACLIIKGMVNVIIIFVDIGCGSVSQVCNTFQNYTVGLVQDCSNSNALAMELLQSRSKPSTWIYACVFLLFRTTLLLALSKIEIHCFCKNNASLNILSQNCYCVHLERTFSLVWNCELQIRVGHNHI